MADKSLDVYYDKRLVGTLALMPDKRVAFQYSADWIKSGFSISPFSLPLKSDVFVPKESSRELFSGLFGVFADSLPDSWGWLLMDRYLVSIGVALEDISILDRLAYIGDSGMGALEYYPSNHADFSIDRLGLNYDDIARQCGRIIDSKVSNELELLYNLGGSSGGTRPKIFIKEGGEDWIIKFPSKNDMDMMGQMEYDYYICAKKCGINMSESKLIPSDICSGYFMTKRFDRIAERKVVSTTFAGLLEADFRAPSCDYNTLMRVIRVLTKDNTHDIEQMYRLMCFNVMAHNLDDHIKNFTMLYSDDLSWRLAPAYDITYSNTYYGEQTTSVNGKGKNILPEDLVDVGLKAGLDRSFCVDIIDLIHNEIKEISCYFTESRSKRKTSTTWKERLGDI